MIPILFTAEAAPEALLDVNSIFLHDVNDVELLASGDTAAARAFSDYGLGVLADCISCEVTEERNGEFELAMEYPVTGKLYDELELRCIVLAKPNYTDASQAFRIYSISTPINGVIQVQARHIIYDLSGVPVLPFTANSCSNACAGLISNAAVSTPFSIGTQIGTIADFEVDVPSSVRSWFGGKEGSLIDVYGGEWAYDNYTATLKSARGADRGVVIRYGKNLIDFNQEENCENTWTGVLPFWANEEGTVVRANIINLVGTYDYTRILCLDCSADFEEQPTTAQLTTRANSYISNNNIGVPKVNITLDYVQVSELTDRVDLCDTVKVIFERIGVETSAKCIRTVWDVLKDRYSSVEFGDAKTNITDTIATLEADTEKAKVSVSATMLNAIANATALITGNEGGYVVLHDGDGDGYPDEILIMDTADISTATKIWRWNKSGLGYSSSGYSGTYGLAMTANGAIVADYITTGTLDASRATITNINASNITSGTINAIAITGGTITGTTINNGSGTFKVDTSGNVTANSLTSSNATITGGSISIGGKSTATTPILTTSFGSYQVRVSGTSIRFYSSTDYLFLSSSFISGGTYTGTIGSETRTQTFSYGPNINVPGVYSNTYSSTANVFVQSNGIFYRATSSSKRYKDHITEDLADLDPEVLYKLPVVRFRFKDGYISEDDERYGKDVIGFIAEDVDKLFPIAVRHEDGEPEMWEANYMIPAMMKLIQNQKKKIDELEERLARLEARFLDDGR